MGQTEISRGMVLDLSAAYLITPCAEQIRQVTLILQANVTMPRVSFTPHILNK